MCFFKKMINIGTFFLFKFFKGSPSIIGNEIINVLTHIAKRRRDKQYNPKHNENNALSTLSEKRH